MSSVVRRGDPCQPLLGQDYAEEARAGGSELSRERTQAPGQGTTERGGIKGARRAYRIDRCRTFTKRTRADDLENWIEAAKETFSTPSKGLGGEKGSVCVLDGADAESSPARGVYGPEGPARCVPGVHAASVEEGSSSLLDYTLTQGEKEKASFRRLWWGYVSSLIDTYQFRAVVAGHVIKLYRYHVAQVCQKGKSCKDRQKREDRTEEEKQRDRSRNLLRARNGLIDTINANVDRPWGSF